MYKFKEYLLTLLLMSIFVCSCSNPLKEEDNDENMIIWKKENSPIVIDSLFHVKENQTLRIEKGVTVLLKGGDMIPDIYDQEIMGSISYQYDIKKEPTVGILKIDGKLDAKGSASEPILFTRLDDGYWGAIYADTSSVIEMNHCTMKYFAGVIPEHKSYFYSGGILFFQSSGSITNCNFGENVGCSIMCRDSSLLIRSNRFEPGGIITINNSSPIIDNNIIINGNTAIGCFGNSSPYIINNTIISNEEGIEIYTTSGKTVIMNNILWNLKSHFLTCSPISKRIFEYNLIGREGYQYETTPGHNLVSINPLFVDEENGDYRLSAESPILDYGSTNIEGYEFPNLDFSGSTRISGDSVDLGANEYQF